jgi:hypothetical protein
MLKNENTNQAIWTTEFVSEINLRSNELKTGKVERKEWNDVLKESKKLIAAILVNTRLKKMLKQVQHDDTLE